MPAATKKFTPEIDAELYDEFVAVAERNGQTKRHVLEQALRFYLRNVVPSQHLVRPEVITIAEQHKQEGPNLWERNPDRCCHVRKVEPLERVLKDFDAWISGIRREQSLTRKDAQRMEWSERYDVWKVQPLVDWDAKRVDAYIRVNEIPYNPLHDAGYPSIGCIPCTRPVVEGEDERAGRWAGSDKLECGIHGNTRLVKESND